MCVCYVKRLYSINFSFFSTDIMFTILLGFISFLFLLHYYIKYRRIGRILQDVPGPKAYPIIGNILRFQSSNLEKTFGKLLEVDKEYYPIYKVWSFFFTSVTLLHPKDIEKLVKSSKNIEKSTAYNYIKPWLSNGLVTSSGDTWQRRRKILTPSFHFNILKHFLITFNEEAKYLVTSLKEETKDGPIIKDTLQLANKHTLNAICETAMGIPLKGKEELQIKYREAVHNFSKIVSYRILRPWYHSDFIFSFSSLGRKQKKLLKTLHDFSSNIITERKRFHQQTNGKYLQNLEEMDENDVFAKESNNTYKNSMSKKKLAMLDLLIAASKDNQINDEGIQEEVDTFMFAGHDTTATSLNFCLLLFAKHKSVQEGIRNEVNNIMQQNDCNLTISMLGQFSYMERCIKESLRLYPSVPSISRYLLEDLQLENHLIPAGVDCRLSIYSIHKDPNYWPNPTIFDPDRFLPENIKNRNPYSYIPFSAGLRNCIGQKYALLEIKVMLAYILHHFRLEPVDELDDAKFMGDMILTSTKPLHVKFIPIK
uniref:cytochrome P450 4C1-like isoform X3 n=1 Tax=Vespula vulgaris TaxID=7454 RepID=UPI00223B5159|nr:cytochrome P450 4C1-like isoform X3 [Vespula vulgaris]